MVFLIKFVYLCLSFFHLSQSMDFNNGCRFQEICQIKSENYFSTSFYIACFGFRNLSVLNKPCHSCLDKQRLKCFSHKRKIIVHPKKRLLLDKDFDIENFLNFFSTLNDIKRFKFKNFLGIDINFLLNYNEKRKNMNFSLIRNIDYFYFLDTKFEFYLNGRRLTYCDRNMSKFLIENGSIFMHIKRLMFDYIYSSNKFPSKLCPFLFQNANIEYLQTQFYTNSFFLITNYLTFESSRDEELKTYELNSTIKSIKMNVYDFRINAKVLHFKVYENLEAVEFEGQYLYFEKGIFEIFEHLTSIKFTLGNMQYFLYSNINSLLGNFRNKTVTFFEVTNAFLNTKLYFYPDEDFCLFARIETKNFRAINIVVIADLRPCSCTIFWLIKDSIESELSDSLKEECYNSTKELFYSNVEKCEFQNRLNKCAAMNFSINEAIKKKQSYFSYRYLYHETRYYLDIIFNVFISLFGIGTNFIIVKLIKKNRANEMKENFYYFMYFNSIFNIIFCLIYLIDIINVCDFSKHHCSSLYGSYFAQFYKIIFVSFLGNALKYASNLTYLLITINRYMLIGKEHIKFLEKIYKISKSVLMAFIIFTSVLLNLPKLFEFVLNEDYENYDYPAWIIDINEPTNSVQDGIFVLVFIAYDMINFLFYSILSVSLDIILIRKLNKTLKEKKKVSSNKKKDDDKSKSGIMMIVLNAIINVLIRLLDLFGVLFSGIVSLQDRNNSFRKLFCGYINLCRGLKDFSNFFFLFSISINIFIYYRFNTGFNKCFKEMFLKKVKQK